MNHLFPISFPFRFAVVTDEVVPSSLFRVASHETCEHSHQSLGPLYNVQRTKPPASLSAVCCLMVDTWYCTKISSPCSVIDTDHERAFQLSAFTAGVPKRQLTRQMRPLDMHDPPHSCDIYKSDAVLDHFVHVLYSTVGGEHALGFKFLMTVTPMRY
jgi:hypothetical protein